MTNASPLTVKLDKTGPTATLAVVAGTAGANGWYTSDVTLQTTGSDSIAAHVTCTPDQFQTTETTGSVFNGSCTNDAGLTANASALTVKLDKTGPTGVLLAVTAGTLGKNGWYTSNVRVSTTGADSVSGPASCTSDQFQTTDTVGAVFNGSCSNQAGLSTNAAPLIVKRDTIPPSLGPGVAPSPILLNGSGTASPNASDATSGLASSSCNALLTSTVGSKSVGCSAMDNAGNIATASANYDVIYALAGSCLGQPGHSILQPVNADGTSVFKQKSTVPVKFRVCDANGVSIGTPGVVSTFRLIQTIAGTTSDVDEAVDSTTEDTAFRWSPTDQQWIFNVSTKNSPVNTANTTYVFRTTLNDGSNIDFRFGLK
jgi:hypothetical protein